MSQSHSFEQFMQIPIIFYKTIGEELFEHRSTNKLKSLLLKMYLYFGFINFNFHVMGEIVFFLKSLGTRETVLQAIAVAPCMFFSFMSNLKQILLASHKPLLRQHLKQLEDLFPTTSKKQSEYKLQHYERIMRRVMVIFTMLCMMYTSTFSFYPACKAFVNYYFLDAPRYERNFGFLVWYPFNATSTRLIYWTTYWSLGHAAYLAGVAFLCADLLLIASVTQLVMHFDYISKQLINFKGNVAKEVENIKFLNGIVDYHAKCLNISEEVNTIFSFSLLFNFLAASLNICFIGFQVTTSTTEDIIMYCIFMIASLVQVFIVCYYGDELMTASFGVGDAAYNQYWFHMGTKYKKILLLIVARSQRPASIRAPTFPPISFNTYMKVISMSYQFFALLRTTYSSD
ncbi:odorant receptor 67c-like [Teleopsis dalmanni]|uniref:odorant receptor 67c-like n=1 Tax=Teleopsis dalmanni TaxID=139649 RepID=UPI0018CE576C|nr:odorant receptor 67c-like [Teleopsis dalmanni]